jgi:hypothetical protein
MEAIMDKAIATNNKRIIIIVFRVKYKIDAKN